MMRNGTRRTICFLFLLLILGLLLLFAVRPTTLPASPEVENLRREISAQKRVVHAGGALTTQVGDEVIYTNSLDALQNMYNAGNRFCEIDIRETSDGVLICAHGDETHLANGSDLPVDAESAAFLSERLFGEFQPMSVEMLTAFMREHPNLVIITDAQGDNLEISQKLADSWPDLLDRFIIQIYHEREYNPIREMGFRNLIYTLYRADDEERNLWEIAHFSETHELVGVTIQKEQFYSMKNRIAMAHCGVPFMFHTVNDGAEIEAMLQKPYVAAVYTDQTE
jgi:glycerophosphoryl diester phosphodiesterase